MQRNNIPMFFMLIAGTITCVLSVINGYELHDLLWRLLIAMLVFYFLGSVLKGCLNRFERQNKAAAAAARKAQEEEEQRLAEEAAAAAAEQESSEEEPQDEE